MMTEFPKQLNDGQYDYNLVRQYRKLPSGVEECALYERIPMDRMHQYTPDLPFVTGQTTKPAMIALSR